MKAIYKNTVVAQSDHTIEVDNTHYFPPDAINSEFFQLSDTHSVSPSNGRASYFHLKVGEEKIPDAAWFYPHPMPEAARIKDYVAFRKEVKVEK